MRVLPPGLWGYDAVRRGDVIETGRAEVTAEMIDTFAALSGDRFAIHMDEAAARSFGFSGRVAHGLLVLSVIDGLKNQAAAQFDAIASLGWDWSFRAPVLAGDTVGATIRLISKRPTRRAERGILRLAFTVTNQSGAVVQEGRNQLMVRRP